ncbi:general stress protein [Geodermatophilus sp. DSM 44513]|uniref:general stress protein n=1 Tax=Geodermatophilus sp. DSM 44513 TaxID=1528104 RepID=UPI0012762315|nr:general stress protein [Geodermatophilus sp. DSM 44513]WNV75262.1 general stress protein [Geodermatophilus sp. DSM 44513]
MDVTPQGTPYDGETTAAGRRMLTLARFPSYPAAQHLIDQLSDAGFPVERTRIVGNGVRSVETVTGRMTKGKAAVYGAGTGAWIGLFIALLFAIFTIGPVWWGVLLTTVLIGAVFGAIAGFVGHWATGGRRDFSSVTALEAAEYEVQVDADLYGEAQRITGQSVR